MVEWPQERVVGRRFWGSRGIVDDADDHVSEMGLGFDLRDDAVGERTPPQDQDAPGQQAASHEAVGGGAKRKDEAKDNQQTRDKRATGDLRFGKEHVKNS